MHVSAHMYKNALINADIKIKKEFLVNLLSSIENIMKDNDLAITVDDLAYFEDPSLYEYAIPIDNKDHKNIYFFTLQVLRVVGLLHDVGHFPFSHQVEYSMEKIYDIIKIKENYTEKEKEFLDIFEHLTQNTQEVLHEAIGKDFVEILFGYELLNDTQNRLKKEYIKLIHILTTKVLKNDKDKFIDYGVIHTIVDGTVDSDRLDYINRDMIASGYMSGGSDFLKITKKTVLVKQKERFIISFFDTAIYDIENMLEIRFNLYKKIINSHKISRLDALLENTILFMAKNYFETTTENINILDSISMLWKFTQEKNMEKKLDIISQLDENWLISLFKKEYFRIKYKEQLSKIDKKYLASFEDVLFGKRRFKSIWKNLNDLYTILEFSKIEKYQYRESFGYLTKKMQKNLEQKLFKFCKRWEKSNQDIFFTYRIISLNIGIDKKFHLFNEQELIKIDEISTVRKRLKKSMLNTVPFFLYSNKKELSSKMKKEIKTIIDEVFSYS